MIYIWLDESDKEGAYYSNFYGGILIPSQYVDEIVEHVKQMMRDLDIREEMKWQKVTSFTLPKYREIVDYTFDLLEQGKAKIRIFFRNNQFKPIGLTHRQKEEGFTILYYEFIKHSFGLRYCDMPKAERSVRLYIDEIPARGSQVSKFKSFILGLNNDVELEQNHIMIHRHDIIEVNSKEHIPLQMLDLVLGSICFRLNDKHKVKQEDTGKRGKRTIAKETLYKHISSRIRRIYPNFNIGESTGFVTVSDRWSHPYRHWSFKPRNSERDKALSKKDRLQPPT